MSFQQSLLSFFNGMVTGWSQVVVMQPFEIIKVRLQTQSQQHKIYNGIVDCLKKIIKNQGFFALYKGSVTPFIGVGLIGSLRFGFYENGKQFIAKQKGYQNTGVLSRAQKSMSALYAAILVSLIISPIEHTRIRIQIQRSQTEKVYSGSLDAARKIYKQHGIRGLNRGQVASTIREAFGLVFYFYIIQRVTQYLAPPHITDKSQLPFYVPFCAGGLAGTFYWVFTYPIDYVKTLMQTDKLGDYKYKSVTDCFRQKYQEHGWKGFYKGYTICMMRSVPVNAVAIVVYRLMQRVTGIQAK